MLKFIPTTDRTAHLRWSCSNLTVPKGLRPPLSHTEQLRDVMDIRLL